MSYKDFIVEKRKIHITLPSGYEFDYILPTGFEYMEYIKQIRESKEGEDIMPKWFGFAAKGLPENDKIEDFVPDDLFYLSEIVKSFFAKVTTSLPGSKITQESS